MYRYEIKALYTPTNRIRTTTIEAQNREDAIARLKMDLNFSEPFVVEEFFDEPTSRQLDYARDLKIKIPQHASIRDVAALIDRAVNHDSDPNPGLIEFAKNRRILFSQYIGKKALYNRVFYELSERDKIAFFAFCVYRHVSDDRHANLDTHPKRQLFYDFAAEKEKDERFTKSMSKYSGEDIRFFGTIKFPDGGEAYGGSISTIAYKTCVDFLQSNCGVEHKTRTLVFDHDTNKDDKRVIRKKTLSELPKPKEHPSPTINPKITKIFQIITLVGLLIVLMVVLIVSFS